MSNTANTNYRLPKLMQPGKYPYISFDQKRSGSWEREDSTPGNESIATGHKTGAVEEWGNAGDHKHFSVGQMYEYTTLGKTTTADLNTHNKVGGGEVHQVTGDKHEEHGGSTTRAVGQDVIHVSNGFMYHHATGGVSQSSVGDKVTDHNDGHDHHNVEGDKVTFIGGTKYENVNAEFGKFVRGNYDVMVLGNSQHTTPVYIVNASQNVIHTTPAIFANTPYFVINSSSGALLTVGNSQTNTLITPTSVTSPAFYVGDPVEFINTTMFTIGSLIVSANGSNGSPGQVLASNGAGAYWENPVSLAAGTNTNVQFNNSNTLYGSNGFNFDYTTNNVTIANTLTVTAISANGSVGTANQVLTSNGTTIYWATVTAGSNVSIGGANTQVEFNDSGTLNATAGFTFNKTTNTIILGNSTVNSSVNSTIYTGTANNATNLGGTAATGYANVTNPSFANITITTNTLNLGVSSLTANGYSYLPNGLLMQWGNITLTTNATTSNTLSFPVAFPHSCFNVSLTANLATGETMGLIAANTTTATVSGYNTGAAQARNFYWSAIGY